MFLKPTLAFSAALVVGACNPSQQGSPAEQQDNLLNAASADEIRDVRDMPFSQFIRTRRTNMVLTPEFSDDASHVRLVKEIDLADFSVKLSFMLSPKGNPELPALYEGWRGARDVTVEWGAVFAKVEGLEAREIPVRIEDLQQVMLDPTVRTICGRYKVVGPMTMTVGGQAYSGSVKMSFTSASYAELGEPVDSKAADIACEDHTYFFVWDVCDTDCKFILPADPRIEATCTLGGIIGMVTGSGTPIAGGGAGQVGVLATTTASCWNEFTGACKLVDAFWGDYCVCSSPNAPHLQCNPAGSPCQGSGGRSCSNPTWSCGSTTGDQTDAGVSEPGGR